MSHSDFAPVKCGTCRECCKSGVIIRAPGDDPSLLWVAAPSNDPNLAGHHILQHKSNGECIYLGSSGCTIHGRHPKTCRIFSCVELVERMERGEFDHLGPRIENAVTRAGRRRMRERRR